MYCSFNADTNLLLAEIIKYDIYGVQIASKMQPELQPNMQVYRLYQYSKRD
jgi:hypothetical protein